MPDACPTICASSSVRPGAPYEATYARTFLCALPRRLRPACASRAAALLVPGGRLFGCIRFSDEPTGPPFGTSREALHELLGAHFALEADREVGDSIPMFRGRERWQVWRPRRPGNVASLPVDAR